MTAAKKRFLVFGLLALAILLVAVLAPVIATHDPNSSVLADAVQSPSGEHWFGTDKMGRDLFSRVIYGTRTSILSTMILVLSILLVGGTLGIVAGYVGGVVETVIMRVADMMVSFPGMALAIALAGMLGGSITSAILAIMAVSWTKYARVDPGTEHSAALYGAVGPPYTGHYRCHRCWRDDAGVGRLLLLRPGRSIHLYRVGVHAQ